MPTEFYLRTFYSERKNNGEAARLVVEQNKLLNVLRKTDDFSAALTQFVMRIVYSSGSNNKNLTHTQMWQPKSARAAISAKMN